MYRFILIPLIFGVLVSCLVATTVLGQDMTVGTADPFAEFPTNLYQTDSFSQPAAIPPHDWAETSIQPAAGTTPGTGPGGTGAGIRGNGNSVNSGDYPWMKVSYETNRLPKEAGQIWAEYDISPYTGPRRSVAAGTSPLPEQVIVDWILKVSPKGTWHGTPFAILSASSDKLYVYHTPEIQAHVAEVVARFVNPNVVSETFSVQVIAVNHPNWRSRVNPVLQPISIATPGVHGALLTKDDAKRVLAELSNRSDHRELCPASVFYNGQWVDATAKKMVSYNQNVIRTQQDGKLMYQVQTGNIQEGYQFSMVCLTDNDPKFALLQFHGDVTQVEKTIPYIVDAPVPGAPGQRLSMDLPQIQTVNIDECVRWPKDTLLLLDLGMVPLPTLQNTNNSFLSNITRLTSSQSGRYNILVFIESRGTVQPVSPQSMSVNNTVAGNTPTGNTVAGGTGTGNNTATPPVAVSPPVSSQTPPPQSPTPPPSQPQPQSTGSPPPPLPSPPPSSAENPSLFPSSGGGQPPQSPKPREPWKRM